MVLVKKESTIIDDKILNEKNIILKYIKENSEEEKFNIIAKLYHDFITLTATSEQSIEFYYENRMDLDDFKNLNSKLTKLCENIEDAFTLISDIFDEQKFTIVEISLSKLVLETNLKITRSVNYPLQLVLRKKVYETEETLKTLCEMVNKLNKEKKNLIQRLNKIEKITIMPEFSLCKFSMVVRTEYKRTINYYKAPTTYNWTYTTSQKNLPNSGSNIYAVISKNIENNIIIYCGTFAPPDSYYVLLDKCPNDSSTQEGVYYDDKYVCPICCTSNEYINGYSVYNDDKKFLCLYGKLIS